MTDPKLDITTLVFLGLAIVVFLKLRSVLGRKSGEDQQRYERYKAEQQARTQAAQRNDNIVTLPQRRGPGPDRQPATVETSETTAARDERLTRFANGNQVLASSLIVVAQADPGFDPAHFMTGAKQAYEMVVMAFAEGNRTLLKELLAADVYEGFEQAIAEREVRGEKVDQSFVGISAANMLEADLKGQQVNVTVKFVSELISAIRSRDGDVLSGDPKKIKEVTDVWTFARDAGAQDPNWRLVATQSAA